MEKGKFGKSAHCWRKTRKAPTPARSPIAPEGTHQTDGEEERYACRKELIEDKLAKKKKKRMAARKR